MGPRSPEGEAENLGARVQEFDLEPPVPNRSRLADQPIHPLLDDGAVTVGVDVRSVCRYIKRRRHPDDRRSVVVEATVKAHSVDEEIFGQIEDRMRRLFGAYEPGELEVILRFLRDTRAVISS